MATKQYWPTVTGRADAGDALCSHALHKLGAWRCGVRSMWPGAALHAVSLSASGSQKDAQVVAGSAKRHLSLCYTNPVIDVACTEAHREHVP